MEILGIVSVPAITIICYLLGMTVRKAPLDNKWIPSIVGGLGMILGFVGWKVIPDYPASDILTAIAVGVVSGLASTGIDQLYHQLNPREHVMIRIPAYEEWDENGDPLDGHFATVHNIEGTVCEATQCATCDDAETCDLSKYIDEVGGDDE